MKPCGYIGTYMSREDWRGKSFWVKLRTMFFNCKLFVFQLIFMIVGTAYGKVNAKIKKPIYVDYILAPTCIFGIVAFIVGITDGLIGGVIVLILLSFVAVTLFAILAAIIRGIDWRKVWRAAQVSHIRLCLEPITPLYGGKVGDWRYINFGYPKAEIQLWRLDQCKGQFEYRDPTFEPSPEFIAAMIEYAEDQVGKRYDWLQLLSPPVNFLIWIFWPPWWGKQIIGWFNLPGGREFCSSGAVAVILWFAEATQINENTRILDGDTSQFFPGYDSAVIPPCLIAIDRNWEET